MNRMFQWMLAAILTISGATVLTSCSNDDDPVMSSEEEHTGVPFIILDADIGSPTSTSTRACAEY